MKLTPEELAYLEQDDRCDACGHLSILHDYEDCYLDSCPCEHRMMPEDSERWAAEKAEREARWAAEKAEREAREAERHKAEKEHRRERARRPLRRQVFVSTSQSLQDLNRNQE